MRTPSPSTPPPPPFPDFVPSATDHNKCCPVHFSHPDLGTRRSSEGADWTRPRQRQEAVMKLQEAGLARKVRSSFMLPQMHRMCLPLNPNDWLTQWPGRKCASPPRLQETGRGPDAAGRRRTVPSFPDAPALFSGTVRRHSRAETVWKAPQSSQKVSAQRWASESFLPPCVTSTMPIYPLVGVNSTLPVYNHYQHSTQELFQGQRQNKLRLPGYWQHGGVEGVRGGGTVALFTGLWSRMEINAVLTAGCH
ncbi:hypothetical protein AAFF_G00256440 [Aldrovandia affinis]|uniref:Uncharacterized protein n=1 Tax=Aldrovandia affinis TaxID=143900 RepID=A0AAD7ST07_9TELE|nr:hypothetical protein AAFF_G00256440 [Aldrovandia affinis]